MPKNENTILNRAPIPLTPQTGGVLSEEQIVGREQVITRFWKVLNRQGIVLYAERRFGKSSVLNKMNAKPPEGFVSIYKGVEGAGNPDEFVRSLFEFVKTEGLIHTGRLKKWEEGFFKITKQIEQLGPVKFRASDQRWQKQFQYIIDELIKTNSGKRIVLMLDEFTIMLNKMEPAEAVSVLGFLREIVQNRYRGTLRLIYCGSIGIDLVLAKLRGNGQHMGDPINHMQKERLFPFTPEEAIYFCQCLCLGCDLKLEPALVKYIIQQTDCIPYFIDAIFDKIQYEAEISRKVIKAALDEILNDATNSNNMRHFYDRIDEYYPDKSLTNRILNMLAKSSKRVSEADIAAVANPGGQVSDSVLKDEIERLRADGYIKRTISKGQRFYQFNYSIIKKWWAINKA